MKKLTPRELEIVGLIAQGLYTKTVADTLKVSKFTVATHIRRAFIKLGVRTRAELVAKVARTANVA